MGTGDLTKKISESVQLEDKIKEVTEPLKQRLPFQTLAELEAAGVNGALLNDGTLYQVINNGDVNGWYAWDGTSVVFCKKRDTDKNIEELSSQVLLSVNRILGPGDFSESNAVYCSNIVRDEIMIGWNGEAISFSYLKGNSHLQFKIPTALMLFFSYKQGVGQMIIALDAAGGYVMNLEFGQSVEYLSVSDTVGVIDVSLFKNLYPTATTIVLGIASTSAEHLQVYRDYLPGETKKIPWLEIGAENIKGGLSPDFLDNPISQLLSADKITTGVRMVGWSDNSVVWTGSSIESIARINLPSSGVIYLSYFGDGDGQAVIVLNESGGYVANVDWGHIVNSSFLTIEGNYILVDVDSLRASNSDSHKLWFCIKSTVKSEISAWLNGVSEDLIVEGKYPIGWLSVGASNIPDNSLPQSKIKGLTTGFEDKKWTSYGDSVTANGGWQEIVTAALGFTKHYNRGIAGAAVVSNSSFNKVTAVQSNIDNNSEDLGLTYYPVSENNFPSPVSSGLLDLPTAFSEQTRINTIPLDSDLVIIWGGVNDVFFKGVNLQVGDITSPLDLDDNYSNNIFQESMLLTLTRIQARCPSAKIGVIGTPYNMDIYNKTSSKAELHYTVNEANRTVCKLLGIPFLDVLETSGINNSNLYNVTDGVHPNERGIKEYYAPKIINFIRSI